MPATVFLRLRNRTNIGVSVTLVSSNIVGLHQDLKLF